MKQANSILFGKLMRIVMLIAALWAGSVSAQTDSTATEEVTDSSAPELISPLVEFSSIQKADNKVELKASFKAKIDGTLTKLEGLNIDFFILADSLENKLGQARTDKNGIASLICQPAVLVLDGEGKLNFKAVYAGSKTMESAEEELSVKRARLEITPVKEDSLLSVQVKLIDLSTGEEVPVPETDLAVYVKRLFNPLKLGEGATDENGVASIEIPGNLPGDANGQLFLEARVEDNETYGNLQAAVTQKWGVPISEEMKGFPRALWSSAPPMWMLITFIVLMTAVWGHYVVIIYELFRLRKEHA